MSLFRNDIQATPRSAWKVLFRLDHVPGKAPFFLVQSAVPIKAGRLGDGVETREYSLPALEQRQPVSFRISVNAVQRSKSGGIRPVRYEHDEPDEFNTPTILEWLSHRLKAGLQDIQIINHQREVLGVDRRGQSRPNSFPVQTDIVDGVAVVGSPDSLQELIIDGVGRAKAYGCGLLTIRAL